VRLWAGLLATMALAAQEPIHLGYVRGVLIEWDTESSGDFSVRAAGSNQVFHFLFDSRTYVEREQHRTPMAGLRKGDYIEVVSDRIPGSSLRYARTIHALIDAPAPQRPGALPGVYRRTRSTLDIIAPRGNLTFTGIIARLSDGSLVLRTRQDGEKTFVRRPDTYYFESGIAVEPSVLKPNTRVFVRAGRNLDNDLEVYQVIWGEILEPNRIQ
jgi:hypothetical protein